MCKADAEPPMPTSTVLEKYKVSLEKLSSSDPDVRYEAISFFVNWLPHYRILDEDFYTSVIQALERILKSPVVKAGTFERDEKGEYQAIRLKAVIALKFMQDRGYNRVSELLTAAQKDPSRDIALEASLPVENKKHAEGCEHHDDEKDKALAKLLDQTFLKMKPDILATLRDKNSSADLKKSSLEMIRSNTVDPVLEDAAASVAEHDSHPDVRAAAMQALENFRPGPGNPPLTETIKRALYAGLKDEYWKTRQAAAAILWIVEKELKVDHLLATMDDPIIDVATAAAVNLENALKNNWGNKDRLLARFAAAAESPFSELRSFAARGLQHCGKENVKKFLDLLLKLVADRNESVVKNAAYSLCTLGGNAKMAIPKLIEFADKSIIPKETSIKIFSCMGKDAKPALPWLIKELKSSMNIDLNSDTILVQVDIARILEEIGPDAATEAVPVLRSFCENMIKKHGSKFKSDLYGHYFISALRAMGTTEATEAEEYLSKLPRQ